MKKGKMELKNDKVIVNCSYRDNYNIKEEYDYQDNIKDIFMIENLIEELEIDKTNITKKYIKNLTNKYNCKKRNKSVSSIWIITSLIAIISALSVVFDITNLYPFINKIGLSFTTGFSIMSSIMCANTYLKNCKTINYLEKKDNGYLLQLKELDKEINNNKTTLKSLKNTIKKGNQSKINENDNIYNLHLEKYKEIMEKLLLFYAIGKNEKEYLKLYKKGLLVRKLRCEQNYNNSEIETVKTYFNSKK